MNETLLERQLEAVARALAKEQTGKESGWIAYRRLARIAIEVYAKRPVMSDVGDVRLEEMERALLQHMDEDDAMTALQVLHPWLAEVERLREENEALRTATETAKWKLIEIRSQVKAALDAIPDTAALPSEDRL